VIEPAQAGTPQSGDEASEEIVEQLAERMPVNVAARLTVLEMLY
jgi:hypothetical protein